MHHSRHRTLRLLLAGVLAALAPLLLGPTGAAPARAASTSIFTVALTSDIDSFNPFLMVEANAYEMSAVMYDYLVGYSMKDMSPQPDLATSWDTSADGKTWTFHVRTGVTWTDGKPLTAADVAYTYNRVLHGTVEANNWSSYLNNVTSVTAPDATTVVMTLSQPNAVLPLLPIPIVPEHVWKNVSEKQVKTYANEPTAGQPVVGSGPFQLVQGTAGGSSARFVANKSYWGGPPHVDQLEYKVFKSNDPAVQALLKGEVDFVEGITPLQVRALQGKRGVVAHNGVSPLFEEIGFNTGAVDTKTLDPIGDGNKALLDPAFRHALGYAVDTKQLVSKAFQGAATPGSTVVPDAYTTWHWKPPADEAFTFDLAKAGRLLDQAGYKKGADGKRTTSDGVPIGTLRLYARSDQKNSVDTMDFFKQWLGELGIDAKVTAMDSGALGDKILAGTYDIFQWDWFVEPDPDSILSDFTCAQRGGTSDSWYCDKDYDAMYKAQNTATDKATRIQIVHAMQQKLYQDAPYIVTAYSTTGEAMRSDRFACFQPQPDPGGVWLIQYGARNYSLLRPASQAGNCSGVTTAVGATTERAEVGGPSTAPTMMLGGGVFALLVVGGGVSMVRRRATVDDRE